MEKVRWALVGTSAFAVDWIGRGIVGADNAELVAVVSRSAERGEQARKKLGASIHYTSVEDIDTSQVDAIDIVTPNTEHAPLTIAAARGGLHVVVEKPMAPSRAECQDMIRAAEGAGTVLAVAHCTEWSPSVSKARDLVAQGAIGKVLDASIGASFNYPPSGAWRQTDSTEDGGGPLFDMGVHAIDVLQSIVGPIERVAAFLDHSVYDYSAEDSTSTLLRFQNGAHGVLISNFNSNQNDFEIIGTEGILRSSSWLGREFSGDLRIEKDSEEKPIELQETMVYVPQTEHVSRCILEGSEPVISGERGLRNIAVITAAIESARTGQVVRV